MFSGIVEVVGSVVSIDKTSDGDWRLLIDVQDMNIEQLAIGDSIAVNGVCLTVIHYEKKIITFDVSNETLSCTSFSDLKEGSPVNLERAMRLSDRINGHLVSGHVDTSADIVELQEDGRSWRFTFKLEKEFLRYISHKGSVCIDGVSLTVNTVSNSGFSVNIIPHTLEHTLFKQYKLGSRVNIEVDMLVRHLERLMQMND